MLKQRILTALMLAPLAIWGILALPPSLFALIVGGIIVVGAWEWARLAGLVTTRERLTYALLVAAILLTLHPLVGAMEGLLVLGIVALIWWSAGLMWVVRYPSATALWTQSRVAPAVAGLLVLVPAWAMLTGLHRAVGPQFVLLLMLLVWGADVGAFFAGRRWGRRKLAPRVSPGKTWEGFIGAIVLSGALAVIAAQLLAIPPAQVGVFIVLCLVTVAVSALGDLIESMFKRLAGVKDSGGLLPGHGGVLDRIDSVTSAAPIFALGLLLLGVRA